MIMNEKTHASTMAMGIIGARYVKETTKHVYFDIPKEVPRGIIEKASKEFIRQTGVGVKVRLV